MFKSILNKCCDKDKEVIKYPCIMQHVSDAKYVVLATTNKTGVILADPCGPAHTKGGYRVNFAFGTAALWKRFEGDITLSND